MHLKKFTKIILILGLLLSLFILVVCLILRGHIGNQKTRNFLSRSIVTSASKLFSLTVPKLSKSNSKTDGRMVNGSDYAMKIAMEFSSKCGNQEQKIIELAKSDTDILNWVASHSGIGFETLYNKEVIAKLSSNSLSGLTRNLMYSLSMTGDTVDGKKKLLMLQICEEMRKRNPKDGAADAIYGLFLINFDNTKTNEAINLLKNSMINSMAVEDSNNYEASFKLAEKLNVEPQLVLSLSVITNNNTSNYGSIINSKILSGEISLQNLGIENTELLIRSINRMSDARIDSMGASETITSFFTLTNILDNADKAFGVENTREIKREIYSNFKHLNDPNNFYTYDSELPEIFHKLNLEESKLLVNDINLLGVNNALRNLNKSNPSIFQNLESYDDQHTELRQQILNYEMSKLQKSL